MTEMVWQGSWRPAERPTLVSERVLAYAFVAIAASASWFVLASTTGVVQEFGGNLGFLGAAAPFASSVPSLVAWSLVLLGALALQATAEAPDARPALRFGLRALGVGALLEVLAAGLAVWVSVLSQHPYALTPATVAKVHDLVRASTVLGAAALFSFAAGALVARARSGGADADPAHTSDVHVDRTRSVWSHDATSWRGVLGALGVALIVGALAQVYELFAAIPASAPPFQLTIVMIEVPAALLWLGVAGSLLLAHGVVARDGRLGGVTLAVAIGAIGAALLGLASAAQLCFYEVWSSNPASSAAAAFGKLSSASTWTGWLLVTTGAAITAIVFDRRRSHPQRSRAFTS